MIRRGNYTNRRFDFTTPQVILPVLLAGIICWVVSYIYSIGYPIYGEVSDTPLWNVICQALPDKTVTYLIGFLLMAGGAFLLHRANYALALIREKSYLPMLLYLLFISTNIDFFPLKSTSLGVFCLILAIYQLFISYHEPESRENAYNAALLISLGSLLWIHLLWFMPLLWFGMYKFRALTIRTFLASLLGISTIYWFVLGWCAYYQDFSLFSVPFSILLRFRISSLAEFSTSQWISILTISGLTIISAINIITHDMEDSLRSRQYLGFLIIMAIWSFILFFLYGQVSEEFLQTACVPTSLLIGHFFTVTRSRWIRWGFAGMFLILFTNLFIQLWNFL